ncbi:MAG: glycerophosphodiester phosphodiesterase family protein, partial [Pseudomonadales bacterium]
SPEVEGVDAQTGDVQLQDDVNLGASESALDLDGAGFIRRAQALGQAVQYWTINDLATMERLALAGADGIMTDDVPALRAVLKAQGFALPAPWIATP